MRNRLALSLSSLVFAITATARAGVSVDAQPIFGPSSLTAGGWSEIAVRIENTDTALARGTVELSSKPTYGDGANVSVRAPFAVAGGSSAVVLLPLSGVGYATTQTLRALDDQGRQLSTQPLPWTPRVGQLLVDLGEGSRLGAALRDATITLGYENGMGSANNQPLTIAQPKWDAKTGDPILPTLAAGYGAATLVLATSDQLVKLSGKELDALTGHVLAGGTLAVVVTRPEDLRHPTMHLLVGGEPTAAPAQRGPLLAPVSIPDDAAEGSPAYEMPALPAPTHQQKPKVEPRNDPSASVFPSPAVLEKFAGYAGGKLTPGPWGASATYGLGEVHLLAFDPTRPPALDDEWSQTRITDLVRHAWDRRAGVVFSHGAPQLDGLAFNAHRQLDPNVNARWIILIAGLFLLAYAVAAGPVNFSLAAKGGKPLRALKRLPVFSAGAFVAIFAMGLFAKGTGGRARHLSLIEAGAGMERGTARRLRGFFTARGHELTVRTSDVNSVIRLEGEREPQGQSLVVDRDGLRLVELATMPWETLVVREDGFASLGAGVSIVPAPGGDAIVRNRVGRDLRGVIVHVPGKAPSYFARIPDGEAVSTANGTTVAPKGSSFRAGTVSVNPFDPSLVDASLDTAASGLASAWTAITTAAGRNVDWFPEELPVVLAQLDGGEGTTTDSSLALESDRALVRIVGWGGMP